MKRGDAGVPSQFCGSWTLFFCKHFILFQQICVAATLVRENAQVNYFFVYDSTRCIVDKLCFASLSFLINILY